MSLVINILTFLTFSTLLNYSVSDDLVNETAVLDDKEYYVGHVIKVNWPRAAQICAAKGMTLASIESETEYNNIRKYLFNNKHWGQRFWLSGSDLPLVNEHIWMSSGAKVSYNKWATNQPAKNPSNRCVRTNETFNWVKASCGELNYYICSRPTEPTCGASGRCLHTYNSQTQV